jgi:hypothetical protein
MHKNVKRKKLHANLQNKSFSSAAINFLESRNVANEFDYYCSGAGQSQFDKIVLHTNELATFAQQVEKDNDVVESSTTFTLMANNTNQQNMPTVSETLLGIAKGCLALGRGLAKGTGQAIERAVYTIVDIIQSKRVFFELADEQMITVPKKQVIEMLNTWEQLIKTKPDKIMIIEEDGVFKMFEVQ